MIGNVNANCSDARENGRDDGRYCGHMTNTLGSEPYPPTTIQFTPVDVRRIGHENH